MTIIVPDKKLFAIILYAAFVNNEHLTTIRDIWKDPWITGSIAASVIGLTGLLISPMILTAIINGLGFGAEGVAASSFGSWFMSLYGGMIARGSLVSVLQSIGAAGLGALGTSISSGFGAAIGVLIGATGGVELAKYLNEIELNETENQILENLVQIEGKTFQNNMNNMVIFTLMPALLYNDVILKCFVETFITSSSFASSKLFTFNINYGSSEFESKEKVNSTIYNSLIDNFEESSVEFIFHGDYIIGYNLDLNDHEPSNKMISLLAEVWKYINGVIVIDIDLDQIRDQIRDQIHDHIKNLSNKFRSKFGKFV